MNVKNYYQFSAEEVKQDINGKQEPLTAAEVKAHQEKFGPNGRPRRQACAEC